MLIINTRSFGRFWLFHGQLITITWVINHRFGSRGDFQHWRTPSAFMCLSSTLAVLADSSLFHGILITVTWAINHPFGSRSDFHHWRTPGCIYVLVINTCSFGQFWPFSWATNHCFMGYYSPFHGLLFTVSGPRSDFHHWRTQAAFICWSWTLAVLADSGLVHALLITVTWDINHHYKGY